MEVGLVLLFLFVIALAQRCDKGDVQVKNGQSRIIKSGSDEDGFIVYVWPESGFEGISLEAEGQDGAQHTAFFPAEEKCFPLGDEWWLLSTWMIEQEVVGSLSLWYWIGSCARKCKMNNVTLNPNNKILTVRAHGASKWYKERPPWGCNYRYLNTQYELKQSKCQVKDGGTSQPDTTTTTICIILGSTAAVVVVVVVLIVIYRRKSERTHLLSSPDHEAVQPEYEMNVTHNDLYESVDNNTTTEQEASYDTEDHVYESADDIFGTSNDIPYSIENITDNDLYESVDNNTTAKQEASYDIEDHVYESADDIFATSKNAPIQH